MFKKVLVAEDIDSINIAVVQTLSDLDADAIVHVKYCDDALLKIRKAIQDNEPFDLLVSDLSFLADHRDNKIASGEELIAAVKKLQPDIKIIAYSIEDKAFRIRKLFDSGISGYVCKGRNSIPQLQQAIRDTFHDKNYLSPELAHIMTDTQLDELDDYDIALLQLLSKGLKQDEIAVHFKASGTTPNSTSAVEKRINRLKISFQANNAIHLVSLAKDLRVI
jgi:DNA-binding NarL/FixJ family response regulator